MTEAQIYFNAYKNILKMCKNRGYTVDDKLDTLGMMEFSSKFKHNDLDVNNGITDKNNLRVHVKILTPSISDIKTDEIIRYYNDYFSETPYTEGKFRAIIIYPSENEKRREKDIENYSTHKYIEFHDVKKISIDIINHIYQPKFRLLSDEEKQNIYKKYNASAMTVGTMCINDPINKYYHGLVHDMYEIKRNGVGIFYRVVTPRMQNGKDKK